MMHCGEHTNRANAAVLRRLRKPSHSCTTRSHKILQFKHYCTDAPI
jgi:hypothetical protein